MDDRDYIERLEAAVILAAASVNAPLELDEMAEEVRRARILRADTPMSHGDAEQVLR